MNAEMVAEYLINETKTLYGKHYVGNRISPLSDLKLTAALDFLKTHTLRKVSLRVNRSLIAWSAGKYALEFTENVPTPMEVLEMQTQGKRIVTLPREQANGKTPYEFVIHDLEHADRFFYCPTLHFSQVQFFSLLKNWIRADLFSNLLAQEDFAKKFNYLISDMNSHPAHMLQYLRHIIQESASTTNTPFPNNLWQHIPVEM
jgi:hypothetical protein